MTIKETPNIITAVLKVTATAEFFDDDASEETVRYVIEQGLEDAGFDVDVALLKEQEPVEPVPEHPVVINTLACGACHAQVARWDMFPRMSRDAKRVYLFRAKFCPECGRKVKWDAVDNQY